MAEIRVGEHTKIAGTDYTCTRYIQLEYDFYAFESSEDWLAEHSATSSVLWACKPKILTKWSAGDVVHVTEHAITLTPLDNPETQELLIYEKLEAKLAEEDISEGRTDTTSASEEQSEAPTDNGGTTSQTCIREALPD